MTSSWSTRWSAGATRRSTTARSDLRAAVGLRLRPSAATPWPRSPGRHCPTSRSSTPCPRWSPSRWSPATTTAAPRARFRLLHLIRQYAERPARRRADAEADPANGTPEHFAALVDQARPGPCSRPGKADWLAEVDRELSNLRRAIAWAVEHRPAAGARAGRRPGPVVLPAGPLQRWAGLGRCRPGRRPRRSGSGVGAGAAARGDAGLSAVRLRRRPPPGRARTRSLPARRRSGPAWPGRSPGPGSIARELGDYDRSVALGTVRPCRSPTGAGDDHGQANQLNFLCFVTWISGRVDEAEPLGREALRRMRDSATARGRSGR